MAQVDDQRQAIIFQQKYLSGLWRFTSLGVESASLSSVELLDEDRRKLLAQLFKVDGEYKFVYNGLNIFLYISGRNTATARIMFSGDMKDLFEFMRVNEFKFNLNEIRESLKHHLKAVTDLQNRLDTLTREGFEIGACSSVD